MNLNNFLITDTSGNKSLTATDLIYCNFCKDNFAEDHYYKYNNTYYCKIKTKQRVNKYRSLNKDIIKVKKSIYYNNNRASISGRSKQYYSDNKDIYREKAHQHYISNRDKIRARVKSYRENNRDKINTYKRITSRRKRKTDPVFVLKQDLRRALHHAMKYKWSYDILIKYLGCSVKMLRLYIESQFKEGMSWSNYGKNGWVVDHVIPLCKYNMSMEEDLFEAWSYLNLQPLWEHDNIIKGVN